LCGLLRRKLTAYQPDQLQGVSGKEHYSKKEAGEDTDILKHLHGSCNFPLLEAGKDFFLYFVMRKPEAVRYQEILSKLRTTLKSYELRKPVALELQNT